MNDVKFCSVLNGVSIFLCFSSNMNHADLIDQPTCINEIGKFSLLASDQHILMVLLFNKVPKFGLGTAVNQSPEY